MLVCSWTYIRLKTDTSINDLEFSIRRQYLGDLDSQWSLIVLKNCGNYPGKCKSTAIECMKQRCFSFYVLVTQFQSVCLISFEITYRTYFKPSLLCARKNLEVVSHSRC